MEMLTDTTGLVIAYGHHLTPPDEDSGLTLHEVDDDLWARLDDGIKTLNADGTISVAPDLAAQEAEQARQQAIADAAEQHKKDAENVMALFPNATPEQVQSFLRLANVTLT